MVALDTLAAYYVQQARKEKDKELRKDYFAQVRKETICKDIQCGQGSVS